MSGDLPTNVSVPGMDDQYRNPEEAGTESNLRQGAAAAVSILNPVGGGFLEDLISDGARVNEKDPSWEEVITMVVIPGRPASIRNASQIWSVLFQRIESAATLLKDGIKDLESWEGQAGEAYRANLNQRVNELHAIIDQHKSITTSLDKSAGELETAIKTIPIPDDMVHEVSAAQVSFANTGQISNGIISGGIFNKLLPIYSNKWVDELREAFTPDWAANKLRDWISDQDDKAKAAYQTLAGQHVATMDGMPQAAMPTINDSNALTVTPTTNTPNGRSPNMPETGTPDMPETKTSDPFSQKGLPETGDLPSTDRPSTDLPSTYPPSTDLPSDPWATPPSIGGGGGGSADLPGTGLAGAGGGGLSGAGMGGGGLGGAGGGLPGGGLGAGTAGAGLPGSGMMGAGMAGTGAGGAARGGGAGRGAGAGRGGLGAMAGGGGQGGAGGGDGDEYSTWLSEDEDVWGSDTDAAPPVLGA